MPSGHGWGLNNPAIAREPSSGPATSLSHPNFPYEGEWAASESGAVPKIAGQYLQLVQGLFGLPGNLLTSPTQFRQRPSGMQLTWLPISSPSIPPQANPLEPPCDSTDNPRHSFWIRRYDDLQDASSVADRTAIFLAVLSAEANDPDTALGSRLGIRIVAHVATGAAPWKVRITGASCSAQLRTSIDTGDPGFSILTATFLSQVRDAAFKAQLRTAAGLPDYRLYLDGLRVVRPTANNAVIDLYVNAPKYDWKSIPYALTVRLAGNLNAGLGAMRIESIQRRALGAQAIVQPPLFPRDPASQAGVGGIVRARANRAPNRMTGFLTPTLLTGLNEALGSTTLTDNHEIEVMQSMVGDRNADETQHEVVVLAQASHVRTRGHTGLSAYQRAQEFFDRMRACGFSPAEYFRQADLPLRMRHRATIRPGPGKDGRTVNAQVDFDPADFEIGDAWNPNVLKPVQVRFALADLKRSSVLARREPLGIAADPRWAWHEFGHVLLCAATAALEFRFAHSAGDALAAILCDPDSQLVSNPRLRYATFPWVYLNRRHDRSVWHGWSWCGTRHRQTRFPADGGASRHKGYDSEQILSTTLFRLYLALGGDTVDKNGNVDAVARREAANYASYLIMRAIWESGADSSAAIETPKQFENALRDADAGTASLGERIGGCAHKLVRWAFEAQGLPVSPDWNAVLNHPANPPAMDLFIDNGRPAAEGPADRGGYTPVSMDWESVTPPLWHADNFITRSQKNIFVDVRNRGHVDVTDARVEVWHANRPASSTVAPKWNSQTGGVPNWTKAGGPAGAKKVDQWPAAAKQFGPFKLPSATAPYWVLAIATCAGDPSNLDASTGLPCSGAAVETRIADLVGGDNNIGVIKA